MNLQRESAGFEDVVISNSDRGALAFDLLTNEVVWQADGFLNMVDNDSAFVCRGQDQNTIVSIDARSGVEQWEALVPCSGLVPQDDSIIIVTFDPEVDGGHLLAQVDRDSGDIFSLVPLDDGIDDQVTGLDGAIGVQGLTVTGGTQANLIVFDAQGREVFRDDDGIGAPLGAVDGVAFFGVFDHVRVYDPVNRQVLARIDADPFSNFVVGDEAVWQLGTRSVARLEPADGNPVWEAEIGVTSSFDVAVSNGVAFVSTNLELIAIDNESGEILWSEPIPR